ncbi:MAG: hydrolase [Acidiferrobacterales bacterium]
MPPTSPFKPAWWCPGAHTQTLWPTLFRHGPRVRVTRERLELPDGDFVDLQWTQNQSGPLVIILHGLEGCWKSSYARGLLNALPQYGLRAVVMHFRGCSGTPNRLGRSYHSGDTGDLAYLVATLRQREPTTPLAAVGYSMGGNVLLKWLGEQGKKAQLHAAIAVSVPFLLAHATDRMNRGFSRVYQWMLLRSMRRRVEQKLCYMTLPVRTANLSALRSFREFDDSITAPLHGFRDAAHYYGAASSRQYLSSIAVDTLILHARDDPFMTEAAIPNPEELSAHVQLELFHCGGHVGFVTGSWPWRARYWLEERIPEYLTTRLSPIQSRKHTPSTANAASESGLEKASKDVSDG